MLNRVIGFRIVDLISMYYILLFLGLFLYQFPSCTASFLHSNISGANFVSQFVMVQHQLRGIFEVIDNCSFRVSQFDMLEGVDVHWWGAMGDDFGNMTQGFVISDDKLNRTYMNDSLVVRLKSNLTWDQFNVVSAWDIPAASNFGHVVLRYPGNGSEIMFNSSNTKPPQISSRTVNEEPTMFDNCRELSKSYRLRWTLKEDVNKIDIGLEAVTGVRNYMAFGWANPSRSSEIMLYSDVTINGFTEDGLPFADDFFITKYSECTTNKDGSVQGVCPDTIYEGNDPIGLTNNTKLVYGHRKDGVSFIRYVRHLVPVDEKYDVRINATVMMRVIWALGLMRPPDTLRPYYLPQYHGSASQNAAFGYFNLNVSEHVNDCFGPLDAEDKEDQDVITPDGKTSLVVTSGLPLHYPNPPNPSKVLFINRKEAPVLRVERGVSLKFSIQAGHDVAFYITSDPLGGNATMRGRNESIYAGGPEAEGVPASPMELVWSPNRNTPDELYYQSLYEQKMGWKMEIVDGGLADMYNNSVVLDDQQVTLLWTLSEKTISFAVRGERKSGYLAIGFGREMVNTFAYVGWIDDNGKGRVSTYYIDGRTAYNIHPTYENLTYVRCKSENDVITFEFTRLLTPPCKPGERRECENIIDPTTPLKIIWAMGAKWSDEDLSERNMHSVTSNRPIRVLLMRGSAEAEQDMRPVLAVHGFMMFVAWGVLLPGGVLSARYLKHVKGDQWFQIHIYLQYSGLAIILLGFVFAVAELRGFYFDSLHVKFGLSAILLAISQPINACFRPKKAVDGEEASNRRNLWEYLHFIIGRCSILVGGAALFSGMKHLGERYGGENVHGLNWALAVWFLLGVLVVLFLECRRSSRTRERGSNRSSWVLGHTDEDDNVDLLNPEKNLSYKEPKPSVRMEIQLEPLGR